MLWLLNLIVLLLLLLSLVNRRKELNPVKWLLIVIFYAAAAMLSIHLFGFKLPIGLLLALFFAIRRRNLNKEYYWRALLFGLVYFVIVQFASNPSLKELRQLDELKNYSSQFERVDSFQFLTEHSAGQDQLRKYAGELNNVNEKSMVIDEKDTQVLFRLEVLRQKGVAVKDLDWLWNNSPLELNYFWQSTVKNSLVKLETITFGQEGYFGVYKRKDEDSPYRLTLYIEFTDFKDGKRPDILP
ncbi:DUF4199 domain-containing protein [Gorillibacterium massiliense]|uniref:DUF4199 domain-containing protein n=1 Tax=Gorillibacterium massiliense TaxID=1280390 RepID=UPI0004B6CF54|nr:DUF4199 domain-containing protein [Gorillibacterium massiliense]